MSVARRTVGLIAALGAALVALTATGPVKAAATPAAPVRDVYRQPFAWNSVWNLPLATGMQYRPFDPRVGRIYPDVENISVNPDAPVKQLRATPGGAVHVQPHLEVDGSWNNCSTLLMDTPHRRTIIEG